MNEPDHGILYRLKKDKYIIRKKEHSLNFSIESGNSYLFTDENNIVTERCYIVNMNYNIRAVDGGAKAIATVQMTVMTDTAPVGNK